MSSNTSNDEVFEYMGNGQRVPKDVVSVRFHPSVVEVDNEALFLWTLDTSSPLLYLQPLIRLSRVPQVSYHILDTD